MSYLSYQIFSETPCAQTTPKGWLRQYLKTQVTGLTGHLEHAGYPFNDDGCAWLPGEKGENDWSWVEFEQRAYWLDGMIRCGLLLEDETLIQKATKRFEYVLEHQRDNGYLGPDILKDATRYPCYGRWSHVVFFRALIAYAGSTQVERIAKALERHYLSDTASHEKGRDVCNVEIMMWGYAQTGNPELLHLAQEAWRGYQPLQKPPFNHITEEQMRVDVPPQGHGVSYNEIAKQPVILYLATGDENQLKVVTSAYAKLERYCMLVDGVHSSSEYLKGQAVLDSHETCDIADYTWSLGYLLMASGDVHYADLIERAIFNATPGAVREDFRGLQYFSCPNQVIADKHSNHNEFFYGESWMSYRPNPGTECCPGDVNRIMPNYIARMWMRNQAGHPVATLYGPSEHRFTIEDTPVKIVETTTYPFEETLRFTITCDAPVSFALTLRIPEWAEGASGTINGTPLATKFTPGTFVPVERKWQDGDVVELTLPMTWKSSNWETGVALERGPLVYALKVEEEWQVDHQDPKSSPEFPAWNLYAASPWNYALILDENNPADSLEFIQKPCSDRPWSIHHAPHEVKIKARRLPAWTLIHQDHIIQRRYKDGAAIHADFEDVRIEGDYNFTPPLPSPAEVAAGLADEVETITLVPYGATKLRVTIFPKVV